MLLWELACTWLYEPQALAVSGGGDTLAASGVCSFCIMRCMSSDMPSALMWCSGSARSLSRASASSMLRSFFTWSKLEMSLACKTVDPSH